MDVALIILNYKTTILTIDTINSVKKITHPNYNYHIYIIDNGSNDGSVEQFTKLYAQDKLINVVPTGSNLGYAEGNNFGLRLALKKDYRYILVMNSDVIVKPNFLTIMVNFLESNPSYGMVGPKIYFAKGYEFHKDRYKEKEKGKVIWSVGGQIDWNNIYGSNIGIDDVDHGQYQQINDDIDYLSGCCILIRTNLLHKTGLFDSKYFMYLEDADYSQRLINSGIKIAYLPESIIWHVNRGSSGGGPLHDYFLTRNRLLFGYRYASLKTKLALFKDSLRLYLFSPYVWQKHGVRDYYLNKLGKGSWK